MENQVEKEKTSILVDGKLWKEFKKFCIDKEISLGDRIDELIRKDMGVK